MKMNTEEHTGDLLTQHEHEIARLKADSSPGQNTPAHVDQEVHRDLRRRQGVRAIKRVF